MPGVQLKGVLCQEADAPLGQLLALEARVRDYVGVLGLELILDETEGYAFVRARGHDAGAQEAVAQAGAPAAADGYGAAALPGAVHESVWRQSASGAGA